MFKILTALVIVISLTAVIPLQTAFSHLTFHQIFAGSRAPSSTDNELAGIKVKDNPRAIAVDPNTNQVYVTYKFSNKLSIINGTTDTVVTDVNIGSPSPAIAVNANTSQVFVVIPANSSIIAVDPTEKEINYRVPTKTSPNSLPGAIFVDTTNNKIYVVNQPYDNISMINADDQSLKVVSDNISSINGGHLGHQIMLPSALAFDSRNNRVYIANYQNNSITTINTGSPEGKKVIIKVGSNPNGIAIDSTNESTKVYVTNSNSKSVTVINASALMNYINGKIQPTKPVTIINRTDTDIVKKFIPVGPNPVALTVDNASHDIYVTNRGNDTVSIIDGKTDKSEIHPVLVGKSPWGIAVNPKSHIVYVADSGSNRISVINGTSGKLVAGLRFGISPSNSTAHIVCKDHSDGKSRTFKNDDFYRYPVGTKISCQAISEDKLISFSSWDSPHNEQYNERNIGSQIPFFFTKLFCTDLPPYLKNNDTTTLYASQYGQVTANFEPAKNFVDKCANQTSLIVLLIVMVSTVLSIFAAKIPFFGKKRIFPSLMRLTPTEILTIDGSVIVGVLILLSLQGNRPQLTEITASIVFPFAISVIVVLMKYYQLGKRLIITGFVNLMISIIILITASYFQ